MWLRGTILQESILPTSCCLDTALHHSWVILSPLRKYLFVERSVCVCICHKCEFWHRIQHCLLCGLQGRPLLFSASQEEMALWSVYWLLHNVAFGTLICTPIFCKWIYTWQKGTYLSFINCDNSIGIYQAFEHSNSSNISSHISKTFCFNKCNFDIHQQFNGW